MRKRKSVKVLGTSLIELLVVIVILLIGILGVIQVFPGGFGVLKTTKAGTMMNELVNSEQDRIHGRADQLAEEIRTTVYTFLGSSLVSIVSDPRVNSGTMLPPGGDGMDPNGNVLINGQTDVLGYAPYVMAANLTRRVIGEGGQVPAPRQVGPDFGGLMVVQFAPIVHNVAYPLLLQVYGNDLVKREGGPGFGRSRSWIYYVDNPGENFAQIIIPRDRFKTFNYRLEFTGWFDNGGFQARDIETTLAVAPNINGGFAAIDFGTLPAVSGLGTFLGVDYDSVRLARSFDEVPNSGSFTADPYEYVLLDANLGVFLFNPRGYNYTEQRANNRRIPLIAKVNYDVFDWRIIRDEFRVPPAEPLLVKTKLDSIKIKGRPGPDGLANRGMDVPISDGQGGGGLQTVDVILVDMETGGVLLYDPTEPRDPSPPPGVSNDYLSADPARCSYAVDKSRGFVRLLDFDRTTPGLQLRVIFPGQTVPATVNADGRLIRALYQGNGEFTVQAMKAPARFRQTWGTPQNAEFYLGQTGTTPVGLPTRIYFPNPDTGKNVTIGEIWYQDGGGNVRLMRSQNFSIVNAPFDPVGPYVDIRTIDPNAVSFDFSNGYSVRYVRGASMIVRALWNPDFYYLNNDASDNWTRFVQYNRGWRKVTVETFLQKEENH